MCFASTFIIVWTIQANDPEWVHFWGEDLNDFGNDIGIDSEDNVYVVGSTANFGEGNDDVLLIKFDDSGEEVWKKTWGGAGVDKGFGMTIDSKDNIYVVGETNSFGNTSDNILLLKYDTDGHLSFNVTWGTNFTDIGYDVVVDSKKNIYVAGIAATESVVLKFNSTGALKWLQKYIFDGDDAFRGIAIDSDDNIYCVSSQPSSYYVSAAIHLLKYSNTGELLWKTTWNSIYSSDYGEDVLIDQEGDIYVGGTSESSLVVIKFTNEGDQIWNRTRYYATGFGIALDNENNVYCVGHKSGVNNTQDIILVKYDTNGVEMWYNTWGTSKEEIGSRMVFNSLNDMYITGYRQNPSDYSTDVILIKNIPPHVDSWEWIFFAIALIIFTLTNLAFFMVYKPRAEKKKIQYATADKENKNAISLELLRNISNEETVLYSLNAEQSGTPIKLKKRFKMPRSRTIIAIILSIAGVTIALGIAFSMIIPIVSLIMLPFFPFILSIDTSTHNFEQFFYFTNKKIYDCTSCGIDQNVHSIDVPSVRCAPVFKNKFDLKKADRGSLIIHSEYGDCFDLSGFSNLQETQRTVESIIYEYGNIPSRWETIKTKLNAQFPYTIKVSDATINELNIKRKQYIILLAAGVPALIAGLIAYVYFFKEGEFLSGIMSFFTTFLSLAISISVIIYKIKAWKKASQRRDQTLTVWLDKVEVSQGKSKNIMPFSPSIAFDAFQIRHVKENSFNWKSDFDGILVKHSLNVREDVEFGPIDIKEFPDVFELIFCAFLSWKKVHCLLMTKDELLTLSSKQEFIKETKEKIAKKLEQQVSPQGIASIPPSDPIYREYATLLAPNDKIYVKHEWKGNYRKTYAWLTILTVGLIALVWVFTTLIYIEDIMWYIIQGLVYLLFLIAYGMTLNSFSEKFKKHVLIYVFTSKKIIIESRLEYCEVLYSNISSFLRKNRANGNYDIEFALKAPVKGSPFSEREIFIKNVTPDNDLVDKLKIFIEASNITV